VSDEELRRLRHGRGEPPTTVAAMRGDRSEVYIRADSIQGLPLHGSRDGARMVEVTTAAYDARKTSAAVVAVLAVTQLLAGGISYGIGVATERADHGQTLLAGFADQAQGIIIMGLGGAGAIAAGIVGAAAIDYVPQEVANRRPTSPYTQAPPTAMHTLTMS